MAKQTHLNLPHFSSHILLLFPFIHSLWFYAPRKSDSDLFIVIYTSHQDLNTDFVVSVHRNTMEQNKVKH